jgi:hypothetical protein
MFLRRFHPPNASRTAATKVNAWPHDPESVKRFSEKIMRKQQSQSGMAKAIPL